MLVEYTNKMRHPLKSSRVLVGILYTAIALQSVTRAIYEPSLMAMIDGQASWASAFEGASRWVLAVLMVGMAVLAFAHKPYAEGMALRGAVAVLAFIVAIDLVVFALPFGGGAFEAYQLRNVTSATVVLIMCLYRIFLINHYLLGGERRGR